MGRGILYRGFGLAAAGLLLAACAGEAPPMAPHAPPRPKPLKDYSAAELAAAYGAPSFTRKENGGEIWRYDVGACRLFFFFFPGADGLSIRHMQSIPKGHPIDVNCRAAFELRRHKRP